VTRRKTVLVVGGIVLLLLLLLPSALPAGQTGQTLEATLEPNAADQTSTVPSALPAASEPTNAPTPSATPLPFVFPAGSEISGADVAGLTVEEAREPVAEAIAAYDRAIALRAHGYTTTLRTLEVLDLPSAEQLVEEAQAGMGDRQGAVEAPVDGAIDRAALEAWVARLAPNLEHVAETVVISDARALTETYTFARTPGRELDVARSVETIAEAITNPAGPEHVDLVMAAGDAEPLPMAELGRVLSEHAGYWDGVAGFYVQNLDTGETLTYNAETVFSGASVMKMPIMLFAYARLGALNDQQRVWMRKMIIDSENLEANDLLAAAVGGQGTEAALQGVNEMSKMLRDLGLEHTYQLIPYESGEWLIQQSMLPSGGPAQEGQAPYTAADRYLRTTPGEMGRLFVMLDECARGAGPLIEKVGGYLDKTLCAEMIGWLQQPHDPERMVAGLPRDTRVAHKGGWIDDMQSDVGIVESPGARYVAAIYIWKDGYVTDEHATPSPYLGDFSHTIYTFFNPVSPDEARQAAADREP